jgi:hypothetical protein
MNNSLANFMHSMDYGARTAYRDPCVNFMINWNIETKNTEDK